MVKATTFALAKILLLAFVAVFLSIAVEQVMPTRAALQPAPAEAQTVALMLFVVQIVLAALFYAAAVQSDLGGWRLYLALFCVYYGLYTVMAQVEAIIFIDALTPLTRPDLVLIMLKNLVTISVYLAVVVLLAGRWRGRPASMPRPAGEIFNRRLVWKVVLLALVYPVFYFGFGFLVAWQFEAVRAYYATTTILDNLWVLRAIQVLRGAAWVLFGLPIFLMFRSNSRAIVYSVLFYALLASIALAIPNSFMPTPVRLAHWLELASSMACFGLLVGAVMAGWNRGVLRAGRGAVAGTA